MPVYLFRAEVPYRVDREVDGWVVADQPQELLKHHGLKVKDLREVPKAALPALDAVSQFQGSLPQIASLLRQLSVQFNAGVPLLKSIEGVSKGDWDPSFEFVLQGIANRLSSGFKFSDALGSFPGFFPAEVLTLIRAGEASGRLHATLESAADLLEKQAEVRNRLASAMLYPLFATGVFLAGSVFLVFFLLPRFAEIFSSLGLQLPFHLSLLSKMSLLFSHPFGLVLGLEALLVCLLLFNSWRKLPKGREVLAKLFESLPLIGHLRRQTSLFRLAQTMSVLLESGVSIQGVLRVCAEGGESARFRHQIRTVLQHLMEGQELGDSFRSAGFPPLFVHFAIVAEETGRISVIFEHLARLLQQEVEESLDTMLQLLEPVLMGAMGIFAGFFLISMMLPLLRLVQGLGAT